MIEFKNVSKVYKGKKVAVDHIDLTINKGEFICLIGTSGSGKTTTMRMINRMIDATSGSISINDKDITAVNPIDLRRKIGYVIQNVGLIPHMTIYENIVIVPKLLKWDEKTCKETAAALMNMVELPEEMLNRYPSELSGGQQQRVGVVRALAANQDIILMDEPFGALDPITRDALQDLVKHLQTELGKTIVFVTHDMDEALKLADRIVVMANGSIIQCDTPSDILKNPASEYVRNLIGVERLLQAETNNRTVSEVMISNVVSITQDRPLREAINLMKSRHVDTLLVTDADNKLLGLIDIDDMDSPALLDKNVSSILNRKVFFVHEDDLIRDTVQKILKRGVKYVPVVNRQKQLVGIITRSSIVDVVYDAVWGENGDAHGKNGGLS